MSDINNQFRQILGRDATADEQSFLGKFIQEGSLQPQEIGQFLQSLPEYQQSQLDKNVGAFDQRLQASDTQALQQGANIAGSQSQARFSGLGRPNSSGLAASVFGQTGRLSQDLAQRRQSALADFYGRGLQQNALMGAQQGQAALQRGYGLRDESRQRQYEIEDYYRQKNDAESARLGQSGWNAITPEFAVNAAIGTAGKIGAAYAGGMGASKGMGLFRPQAPSGLRAY